MNAGKLVLRCAGMRSRLFAWTPWLLVPLLATTLVFLPSCRGEFVWDDVVFITRWIAGTHTFHQIFFPDPIVIGAPFYYRPLVQGQSYLFYLVFGLHYGWWHLANIAIHLGTVLG